MPVADTELLFAFNPKDPKHLYVNKLLKKIRGVLVPDTALLEFQLTLKARGRKPSEVREALLALYQILGEKKLSERKTLGLSLLILQSELEAKYQLSYFDSLLAASALTADKQIISDDKVFDKIPELKRIPIST